MFVGFFVDRMTSEEHDNPMTQVNTSFSKIEQWLRQKDKKEIVNDELLESFRVWVLKFNALVNDTFNAQCKTGLYTLSFYFLDCVVKDMGGFGSF